jgi:hypothetical protein
MHQHPGRSRWLLSLAVATTLLFVHFVRAESGSELDRLLDSPLNSHPVTDSWLPRFTSSIEASLTARERWQNPEGALRLRTRYAYPTYYRFGQRLPESYNDQHLRFWSNSYGGPWYYPGSPANTRSSWLEWPNTDW